MATSDRSLEAALEAYRSACELGYDDGCAAVAELAVAADGASNAAAGPPPTP